MTLEAFDNSVTRHPYLPEQFKFSFFTVIDESKGNRLPDVFALLFFLDLDSLMKWYAYST